MVSNLGQGAALFNKPIVATQSMLCKTFLGKVYSIFC